MGRKRLVVGEPCRHGHPWNRSADGKRCLTCYPNRLPYALLPAEKQKEIDARLAARQKAWAEKRVKTSQQRYRNESLSESERRKRATKNADFCLRAVRQLNGRRAPHQPRATRKELRALWERQGGRCALTGLPIRGTPHLDHITPVSKNGGHTIDNLQWTCAEANRAKGTLSVEEFQDWLLSAAEALKKRTLAALF